MKTETITVRITPFEKSTITKTGIRTSELIRQLLEKHRCYVDTEENS